MKLLEHLGSGTTTCLAVFSQSGEAGEELIERTPKSLENRNWQTFGAILINDIPRHSFM